LSSEAFIFINYKHDLFYLWQNMSGAAIAASRKIKIFLIVGAVTGQKKTHQETVVNTATSPASGGQIL